MSAASLEPGNVNQSQPSPHAVSLFPVDDNSDAVADVAQYSKQWWLEAPYDVSVGGGLGLSTTKPIRSVRALSVVIVRTDKLCSLEALTLLALLCAA